MTKQTYRALGLLLLGSALVAACTTTARRSNDDDDGGSGGFGGAGGATTSAQGGATNQTSSTTTTVTTVTTTGPTTVASTTTGPMGCDTGLGMNIDSQACITCVQCTQQSDCASEWGACGANTSCDSFVNCLTNCDTQCGSDQVCYDDCTGATNETSTCVSTNGCMNSFQQGCSDYLTALSCSICQFCPGDCDAANNCN